MNVKDIVSRYMQSRSGQDHIEYDDLTEVGAEDVESMGVPVESPDTFNGVLFRATEEVQDGTHSGDVYVIYDELDGEGGILIMDRDGGLDESLGADASEEEIFSVIDTVVEKVLNHADVYTHGQTRDDFREESKMSIADRMIQEVLQGKTAESVTTSYFYYPPVTQTKRRKKKARIIEPLIGKGTSKKERTEMKRISLVETAKQRKRPVREQDEEDYSRGEEDYSEYLELLLDDHRGVYIPRDFADEFKYAAFGVTDEQAETLREGPTEENSEAYWWVWDDVLDKARYTDENGIEWGLHQDGALFMVRMDAPDEMWDAWQR